MRIEIFCSAVLAGIAISIGGWAFTVLRGTIGAIAFTFGLLTVVHYRWKLYTGVIGFVEKPRELWLSFITLAGNLVGCLLVALLARISPLEVSETAGTILSTRLATGALQCGLLAIGCGFIVTTAVTFGRKGQWLPLLFGVPIFIICGFPHCIADAFYYLASPFSMLHENWIDVMSLYLCIVIGNFIGCNLYRIILPPRMRTRTDA